MSEVARVMRPSAGALFIEPLGHNPVINLYRRRTPEQRTVDEHPLLMDDMAVVRAHFAQVDETYFHLLGLLALLALPMAGTAAVRSGPGRPGRAGPGGLPHRPAPLRLDDRAAPGRAAPLRLCSDG